MYMYKGGIEREKESERERERERERIMKNAKDRGMVDHNTLYLGPCFC